LAPSKSDRNEIAEPIANLLFAQEIQRFARFWVFQESTSVTLGITGIYTQDAEHQMSPSITAIGLLPKAGWIA
jgi:hypothetical protein